MYAVAMVAVVMVTEDGSEGWEEHPSSMGCVGWGVWFSLTRDDGCPYFIREVRYMVYVVVCAYTHTYIPT